MSTPVAELDATLQSMLHLKPPGVTGSKITSLTSLCNANIQSETVLIQRIYTHFKKAPSTHKLGVLYVVDSVTRAWVEQARKAGQAIGPNENPLDGTYAAGHKRVTELLPSFMNDIIATCPDDQKARITKLIDIWERSGTFQPDLMAMCRDKVKAEEAKSRSKMARTTTPTGSPPKDFIPLNDNTNVAPPAPQPPQDTSSILQALASMARPNPVDPSKPPQASDSNFPTSQNLYGQTMPAPVNQAASAPPFAQAMGGPNIPTGGNMFGGMSNPPNFSQPPQGGLMNMQVNPNPQPQNVALPQDQILQVQFLQLLHAQGVPQEQWATALQALTAANLGNAGNAAGQQQIQNQNQYGGNSSRDRPGAGDQYNRRSSPTRYRRSRSRSPSGYDRRREASPRRRRDSPSYGSYGRGNDRGGIANQYRQRSPDRRRRSDSPRGRDPTLPPPGPKFLEFDKTLPPDHFRVLSRTLFVGGVTSSEDRLRSIFDKFGTVQTCIVNVDKRHAFVKMLTRDDAVRAKEGMERYRSQEMQLRTRWGVGFGPRDCSDYSTGISIIPIGRLTDADRKWILTAEYGGTGGKPLEGGMVVEEPDIEIGAGVSSKAISRRMVTDRGGQKGPISGGGRDNARDGPQADNYRQRPPWEEQSHSNSSSNRRGSGDGGNMGGTGGGMAANAFPNFPNFPQLPGGFQFPPGFQFPNMPGMPNAGSPAGGQPPASGPGN
ncbi:MAG: hypothetical protein OHK93_008524 [Ramalina farinacea]|uniref:RNA binding protein Nrd1 n=1 Tax=Ramalina farinacea TaxID=258253 RepID=A0AA43QML1_9LECA|nr:hypothetical protein [Ramalina farinacea]